jgi:hypothetical protein
VKHVPEWFPGAGFHKVAKDSKKDLDGSVNLPLEHMKCSMVWHPFVSGWLSVDRTEQHEPATASSIVGNALENMHTDQGIDEDVIRGAGATGYLAGSDTVTHL